jgi:hypothetical protein
MTVLIIVSVAIIAGIVAYQASKKKPDQDTLQAALAPEKIEPVAPPVEVAPVEEPQAEVAQVQEEEKAPKKVAAKKVATEVKPVVKKVAVKKAK